MPFSFVTLLNTHQHTLKMGALPLFQSFFGLVCSTEKGIDLTLNESTWEDVGWAICGLNLEQSDVFIFVFPDIVVCCVWMSIESDKFPLFVNEVITRVENEIVVTEIPIAQYPKSWTAWKTLAKYAFFLWFFIDIYWFRYATARK